MDEADVFAEMDKRELWMAWTEKPGNKIVPDKRKLAALEAAASALAFGGSVEEKQMAGMIEGLLEFSRGTQQTFETVKSWFPEHSRKYLSPADTGETDCLSCSPVH